MGRGCRIDINSLPPKYRQQVLDQLNEKKNSNGVTSENADVEPRTRDEPMAKEETEGDDTQACSIHIHSVRKRLTDPDGCCGKYAVDGLVAKGILRDDDPKRVKEVSFSQEKGTEEKTIITIEWHE